MTTTPTTTTITPAVRARVTDIISAGLVSGLGRPVPGQLCLEAAICLALGEQHGDRPSCVAAPDRGFAIRLQDAYPGTPEERAAVFLPLGLAQLGTAGTDRTAWLMSIIDGTIRKIVPEWLKLAAVKCPDHSDALLAAAARCESEGTQAAARAAREVARAAATATDAYAAAAYAAAAAAAAAYAAAAAAAYAAADAADAADAAYAAADAADAAAAAYAAAAYAASDRRRIIELSVSIALEAYRAEGRHQ